MTDTHKKRLMRLLTESPSQNPPLPPLHDRIIEVLLQMVTDVSLVHNRVGETGELARYSDKLRKHLGREITGLSDADTRRAINFLLREHGKQITSIRQRISRHRIRRNRIADTAHSLAKEVDRLIDLSKKG